MLSPSMIVSVLGQVTISGLHPEPLLLNLTLFQGIPRRIWCLLGNYDLPGFGERDPHVGWNLHSSAMDMSGWLDA
ncbi:hypothetical protein M8C21_018172 [Ambrosia artemisiifolia]|uniref:Uncharacterized protein n=1 Tax=Ambrosia artemisiifolia TaxID=4212 RepID=A0AAD5GT97_AMBAR|nr:hypothetical protein M8C21_018172 [Ambrosia artemisiifolia]